eukprot:TRINITY_DN1337_c0_g2_i1.p1 TRINITY_DN1337_c0_g2~~TRINITY_DN1337_c0_g2_i1.p1  ORF type:complete len:540 (-),score=129.60 TRINITY_DN1337_c0_g2_i1:95-1648(-)
MSIQDSSVRLTKIVGTVGPASSSPAAIEKFILKGLNVFRLNFSHGKHEEKLEVIKCIRETSRRLHIPVGILGDLQGPKIRVGNFVNDSIMLKQGETVLVRAGSELGTEGSVYTPNVEVVDNLKENQRILLDDGNLVMIVSKVEKEGNKTTLHCLVKVGGKLSNHKGMNVPDLAIPVPAMTEKDKVDATFIASQNLDWVALSFVQRASDVVELREFLEAQPHDEDIPLPLIIAKIEKPQALDEIDSIMEVVDGIMVARGDLGVECSLPKVPLAQKRLIRQANLLGKPVITATQMLESMIERPTPTRAETSDVANSVFDGTDAVMLSAECAVGKYPCETVEFMGEICREAESDREFFLSDIVKLRSSADKFRTDYRQFAIAQSVANAAKIGHATAIICFSFFGNMAMEVSRSRPNVPVFALTPYECVANRLAVAWGVFPVLINQKLTTDEYVCEAEDKVGARGIIMDKETVVICAGQTPLVALSNLMILMKFGDGNRSSTAKKTWASTISNVRHKMSHH